LANQRNVIDGPPATEAALSHTLDERGQQLLATDDAVDDQADEDGQIRQQGRARQTLLERLFRVHDRPEFAVHLVARRVANGVERRRGR